MRALGSLVADALAVFVFVAIGLLQHGLTLNTDSVVSVGWTFAVGMLVGHLAIRSWRAPFALWPQGVFVWAITLVGAMALRTLFSQGTEVSFIVVTAIVLGVLMLGWRAVASFVTRHERREVLTPDQLEARTDGDDAAVDGAAVDDAAEADAPGPVESRSPAAEPEQRA